MTFSAQVFQTDFLHTRRGHEVKERKKLSGSSDSKMGKVFSHQSACTWLSAISSSRFLFDFIPLPAFQIAAVNLTQRGETPRHISQLSITSQGLRGELLKGRGEPRPPGLTWTPSRDGGRNRDLTQSHCHFRGEVRLHCHRRRPLHPPAPTLVQRRDDISLPEMKLAEVFISAPLPQDTTLLTDFSLLLLAKLEKTLKISTFLSQWKTSSSTANIFSFLYGNIFTNTFNCVCCPCSSAAVHSSRSWDAWITKTHTP